MKKILLAAAIAGLASMALPVQAGGLSYFLQDFQKASANGKATTILGIDNDSLLLNRDDGFYTSGLRLAHQFALRETDRVTTFGWRIGQELYTNSNINLHPSRVGPPDHPYAGWLYGGVYKEVRRTDGTHDKFGLDIGCLGPCAGGEWTQTNLHRLLNQPLPQGWSRQVRNEWGAVLYGELAPVSWKLAPWAEATPELHGRIGNIFADAGIGVTVRAGDLPALPDQDGWFGFVRLDATAVAYNATLQGGYFSDSSPHTVKPKRLTGEAEAGLVWSKGAYGAQLSIIRRGNEIKDLPNNQGTQNFIRLVFSYSP